MKIKLLAIAFGLFGMLILLPKSVKACVCYQDEIYFCDLNANQNGCDSASSSNAYGGSDTSCSGAGLCGGTGCKVDTVGPYASSCDFHQNATNVWCSTSTGSYGPAVCGCSSCPACSDPSCTPNSACPSCGFAGDTRDGTNSCGACIATCDAKPNPCCTRSCADPSTVCSLVPIPDTANCTNDCPPGNKCDAPTASGSWTLSPATGTYVQNSLTINLSWTPPSINWNGGLSCGSAGSYQVCLGTNAGDPCSGAVLDATTAGTSYSVNVPSYATYYWKVRAVNSCGAGSGWSTSQNVTTQSIAKSCSVSLSSTEVGINQPLTLTLSADGHSTYGSLFYIYSLLHTGVNTWPRMPSNNISPAATEVISGVVPYYYYDLTSSAGCTSFETNCTKSTTLYYPTAGNYQLFCQTYQDPNKCTGNTICNINGGPANCTGTWVQCGGSDSVDFCVDGFNAPADVNAGNSYVTGWSAWGTCSGGAGSQRSRTRSCTGDCSGKLACKTYLDSKVGCLNGANCSGGVWNGAGYTQTETESCQGIVSGHVFDATYCTDCLTCPTSSPLTASSSFVVGLANNLISSNPISMAANGTFSFTGYAPNDFTFNFANLFASGVVGDATPKLYCNNGTSLSPRLPEPATSCRDASCNVLANVDFGMWRVFGGWWQTVGGNVHAETVVKSVVPSSLPAASQYLMLADATGREGILTYGTSLDLGSNTSAKVNPSTKFSVGTYSGVKYNYDYFEAATRTITSTNWAGGNLPAYSDGGNGYMLLKASGAVSLNATTVAAGQKYVILSSGDVSVMGDVVVNNGGFLAVISKGNINFDTSVAKAQGWFVSNGVIGIPCVTSGASCKDTAAGGDVQFVGQGSFVGWGGFSFTRTRGTTNNTAPSETFSYRKDLMDNAPSIIKTNFESTSPGQ